VDWLNKKRGGEERFDEGCSRTDEAFEEILRDCIDSVLGEVLGDVGSAVLLRQVGGASLSNGIEFFAEALERVFGAGAFLLETLIIRRLYMELKIEYAEKAGYKFADYVKEAKTKWQTQKGVDKDINV